MADIGNGKVSSKSSFAKGFHPSAEIPKDTLSMVSGFSRDAISFYTNPNKRRELQEQGKIFTALRIRDELVSAENQIVVNNTNTKLQQKWEEIALDLARALWYSAMEDYLKGDKDTIKIAQGNLRKAGNILAKQRIELLKSAESFIIAGDIINLLEGCVERQKQGDFSFADDNLQIQLIEEFFSVLFKLRGNLKENEKLKRANGKFCDVKEYLSILSEFVSNWRKEIESKKPQL